MITLPEILIYLSILSPIGPIILLLILKGKRTTAIHILTGVVLISFLSDIICFILAKNRLNNSVIVNTYFIIQFFLLLYFYHCQIRNKKIIYITVIVFIFFFVTNTIFVQPFNTFQNWLHVAGGLIFICYSTGYYISVSRSVPPMDPFHSSPFWINTAVFYYFSFNLFLFIVTNYVFTQLPKEEIRVFWTFHNFNNIIKNLLFAFAVIVFKRNICKI